MKNIIYIFLIFLLFCNCYDPNVALFSHRCSKEQFEKVMYESKWCDDNTEYSGTYCFNCSIIRNCDEIIKDNED